MEEIAFQLLNPDKHSMALKNKKKTDLRRHFSASDISENRVLFEKEVPILGNEDQKNQD